MIDTLLAPWCAALLGPHAGEGLIAAVCAAVAALLAALIALGFGPLRGWLGLTGAPPAGHGRGGEWELGLLGAWRLYRQLGRARELLPRAVPPSPAWTGPVEEGTQPCAT